MPTSPTSLDLAYALLREGRLVDAEHVMVRELDAAERAHGRGSPQWASAQCDLGNVLLNADQVDRAVDCYRAACAGPAPADPDALKDHLTYRLNLGTVLAMAGRLDEAEDELRRNLRERQDFYGRGHAGYAFGLEPLAEVLFRRGDLRAARAAVEETIANFHDNRHERIATALALKARIVTAAGDGEPPFPDLGQLPDEIVEEVAYSVLNRLGDQPGPDRVLLARLAEAMEQRLGPDHQTTLNVLSQLANSGRDHGDEAGRLAAIGKVLASYDRQGRAEDALMAALGLALAQSDGGDLDAALRTYAEARARAHAIGRSGLTAQVLRNWGLALAEADRPAEAEDRLREAVAAAEVSGDQELLGRVRVAYGLFLQHHGRLDDAGRMVETGLTTLDVAHPDALMGRSHLQAIKDGRSCGCGDLPGVVAEAFREFVLSRLPQDLLAGLDVTVAEGDFSVSVELRRAPTGDELERLNRVIQSATAEFRRRVTAPL
ncbi:MAG TPA: tetratricopeptide repeat protein [Nonomuraea sp.]|nr:tetratricopeptide repeat protein [Nonomuraea sp.]